MTDTTTRRARLQQLLDLAMIYRGWTRKELAEALGRDPTKLVPSTGNPKLDFLVELADVLDWPVGDVTECLWGGLEVPDSQPAIAPFDDLYDAGRKAHAEGRYRDLVRLGREALDAADSPTKRALAHNRICGGWEGMGRYVRSMESARTALREHGIEPDVRRMLQSNLANAAYALWNLTEARTGSSDLVDHFRMQPPTTDRDRRTAAYALYVLGSTHRRLIDLEPDRAQHHAAASRSLLLEAAQSLDAAAGRDDRLPGIARTCRGGVLEADVVLGRLDARGAIANIVDALSMVIDLNDEPCGDRLESHGWWCVFGCNIALRHLSNTTDQQRLLALLTNKANDIADRLENWSMRERIFSLQFCNAKNRSADAAPMLIDKEDARLITGTMGRFPQFRSTGWALLRNISAPVTS
jgi:hypothetical protein